MSWHLTSDIMPPLHKPVIVQYKSGQIAIASCGQRGQHRTWGNHGSCRRKGDAPVKWCEIPADDADNGNVDKTEKEITP